MIARVQKAGGGVERANLYLTFIILSFLIFKICFLGTKKRDSG